MKFEYLTVMIPQGGEDSKCIALEMNRFGSEGWEFCDWVDDWRFSDGAGPNWREALFKRGAVS